MTDTVTIGIPFYNNVRTLRYAVLSVLAQTHTQWKLILINDGSSDDSLEIAEAFSDSRIQVISDGDNRRLPARLNQIATLSDTKYLARMDADDMMHPTRISVQLEYLKRHENVDIVGSSSIYIDQNNIPFGFSRALDLEGISKTPLYYIFSHPTVMGKTDWFLNNPYNEQNVRGEDYELWINTFETSVFRNISEPLMYYRRIFNFRNYILSVKSVIQTTRKQMPHTVSAWNGHWHIFKMFTKSFIIRMLMFPSIRERVFNLYVKKLTMKDIQDHSTIIESISGKKII